jgi:predicted ArsR family transcriptional regulator
MVVKCPAPVVVDMSPPGREVQYTESDVIDVFKDRGDYAEPLTAKEIADRLGCSRRTALNKLHDLEAETDITSKKVGGRSRVWWIPVHVN